MLLAELGRGLLLRELGGGHYLGRGGRLQGEGVLSLVQGDQGADSETSGEPFRDEDGDHDTSYVNVEGHDDHLHKVVMMSHPLWLGLRPRPKRLPIKLKKLQRKHILKKLDLLTF